MSSAKDNNNDVDDDDTIDEDEIDDWLDSDDEDNTKEKEEEEKQETVLNAVEKQEQERERKRNEQEEEEEAKREREEEREKQRREQVELEVRRAAEIAAARKKQEEEEAEAKRRQFEEQEKRLREEKAKAQRVKETAEKKEEEELKATRQMEEERCEREETVRKEVAARVEADELKARRDTEAASFEAKKSEQATIEVLDAVGERNNAHHHQPPNEFDELAQSSTVVGGLFGSFKALKSAASKTVTAVKSHEFTRQMTSDIRELSKHIAGDDVAEPSTKIPTTTTELGEDDRTRQRARDEVDALEIAEKLASKTWHAIGGITNKGKKLARDVDGSIKEKGLGATAEKYGKSALFGIEKVLSNATKVIAAGIEDETRTNSRLAENLQEYGVFEYLDAIDVKTKDAEEKFKALDFEAANYMAKACADILSPAQSQEMGSPLKINTNQEFEEMDMHNHEAETSPVKKSGKIHAQKVAESVQRVSALLQEAMRKPDESATKRALNMIEIAENELEGVRESAIVGFTELTVFAMQQFEEVSEALSKDEIDVSRWGSTVESRAKYVETTICRVENEIRFFRNAVSTEVETLGVFSTNAGGNIPTVLQVVTSLLDDIDNDLLECLDIFEDAKGMIIPAIVVSCL